MLNAAKKEQSIPKMKWVRGILGILCIGTGYVLALNMAEWKALGNAILGVFILECVGTYLFFGSFLGIILFQCTKNKKLIYKGSRLISFSNTLFRLGSHYRSFAMSAILSAATVGAFSMSLSLKDYASGHVLIEAPYSISYINEDEKIDNQIKQIIKGSTHQIIKENQSHFIKGEVSYNNGEEKVTKKCLMTSYSEIQRALEVTEFKNYKKILEQIRPSEGEVINILRAKTLVSQIRGKGNTYKIKGQSYKLKKQIQLPFIGEMPDIGQYETYVITDKAYGILKQNEEEFTLKGINFTHPEDSLKLVKDLAKVIPHGVTNFNSYVQQYEYKYYVIGVFYFLGLVMSIVFMIATFSTIYFKILSDSLLDRHQYKMLMKIGMNKDEITKSIYTQVGIAFVLPTLIGCMHSIFAIKTLETFMHYHFIKSICIGVSIFIIVMIIFYIFITKKYRDKVYEG
jgi:putative ABC transport system permease protein